MISIIDLSIAFSTLHSALKLLSTCKCLSCIKFELQVFRLSMGNKQKGDTKNLQLNEPIKEVTSSKRNAKNIKKLLILGNGGSGKSTVFKQLRRLHGGGYSFKDRLHFQDHIFAQIIDEMRLCLEGIDMLKEDQPDEYKDLELSSHGKEAADTLLDAPSLQVCQSSFNMIAI